MVENEKQEESTFKRKVDILNNFLDSSSSAGGGGGGSSCSPGRTSSSTLADGIILGSESCPRSSIHSLQSDYSKLTDAETIVGSNRISSALSSYSTLKDGDEASTSITALMVGTRSYTGKLDSDSFSTSCGRLSEVDSISVSRSSVMGGGSDVLSCANNQDVLDEDMDFASNKYLSSSTRRILAKISKGEYNTPDSKYSSSQSCLSKISEDNFTTTASKKFSSQSCLSKISEDDYTVNSKYSSQSCLSKISDDYVASSKDSTRSCLSKLTDDDVPLDHSTYVTRTTSSCMDNNFLDRKSVSSYSMTSILNDKDEEFTVINDDEIEAPSYNKDKVAEILRRARDLCEYSENVHSNLVDTNSYSYSHISEEAEIKSPENIATEKVPSSRSRKASRFVILEESDIDDEKENIIVNDVNDYQPRSRKASQFILLDEGNNDDKEDSVEYVPRSRKASRFVLLEEEDINEKDDIEDYQPPRSRKASRFVMDEKDDLIDYERAATTTYEGLAALVTKNLADPSEGSDSSTSYLEVLSDNGFNDCEYSLVLPERPDGSRNW